MCRHACSVLVGFRPSEMFITSMSFGKVERWLKDLPVFNSEQNTFFSKFLCGLVYSFLTSANVCLLGHQILKRKGEPAVSSLDYQREAHFRAKQIIAAQATKCCY